MRIVTPGTVTDEALLDEHARHGCSPALQRRRRGSASPGSTSPAAGSASPRSTSATRSHAELERLQPAELLVAEDADAPHGLDAQSASARRPPWHFDPDTGTRAALRAVRHARPRGLRLRGRAARDRRGRRLLQYVQDTQSAALPHLRSAAPSSGASRPSLMDAATRRNLELDTSLRRAREHTLAACSWTAARPPMGGRLLRRWLHRPLRDRASCSAASTRSTRCSTRRLARALQRRAHATIGDLERILARVALRSARPRDLAQLRDALASLPALRAALAALRRAAARGARRDDRRARRGRAALLAPRARRSAAGAAARRRRHRARLRRRARRAARASATNADQFLVDLEARERARTGIATLKVGYNRVHGYLHRDQQAPGRQARRRTTSAARRSRAPSATSRPSSRSSRTRC